MTLLDKLQSLIILVAILVGLAISSAPWGSQYAGRFILPLLMLMLTSVFLHVPLRQFANAFRHRRVAVSSLVINFLWTPLLAWLLGWLFLRDESALWIGLMMLMVTPCTDWYLVFTGIARGNVALSTALLPVNLVLQMLLLPVYLLVLAGALIPLEVEFLLKSTVLVLFLPLLAAIVVRRLASAIKGEGWLERRVLPIAQSGQILFLGLAIVAMFASEGRVVMQNPQVFLYLLSPVLLFFVINMAIGLVVGRVLNTTYENVASLCCTTLARNSPIALTIALVAFPEQPLIALALAIGPLIELPVLGAVSQALLWISRRGMFPSAAAPSRRQPESRPSEAIPTAQK